MLFLSIIVNYLQSVQLNSDSSSTANIYINITNDSEITFLPSFSRRILVLWSATNFYPFKFIVLCKAAGNHFSGSVNPFRPLMVRWQLARAFQTFLPAHWWFGDRALLTKPYCQPYWHSLSPTDGPVTEPYWHSLPPTDGPVTEHYWHSLSPTDGPVTEPYWQSLSPTNVPAIEPYWNSLPELVNHHLICQTVSLVVHLCTCNALLRSTCYCAGS